MNSRRYSYNTKRGLQNKYYTGRSTPSLYVYSDDEAASRAALLEQSLFSHQRSGIAEKQSYWSPTTTPPHHAFTAASTAGSVPAASRVSRSRHSAVEKTSTKRPTSAADQTNDSFQYNRFRANSAQDMYEASLIRRTGPTPTGAGNRHIPIFSSTGPDDDVTSLCQQSQRNLKDDQVENLDSIEKTSPTGNLQPPTFEISAMQLKERDGINSCKYVRSESDDEEEQKMVEKNKVGKTGADGIKLNITEPLIKRDEAGTVERVIEDDERLRVWPCTSPPYRWICRLEMDTIYGTGWFCSLTYSQPTILTCAHNLYMHNEGGWIDQVRVYPGRDGDDVPYGYFTVTKSLCRVPDAWRNESGGKPEDDWAVIFLPKKERKSVSAYYGFSYNIMFDDELEERIVNVCGYPGRTSKIPSSTMWLAGGQIKHVTSKRIYYSNDTSGGQSGSPLWTWDKYNWKAIGIHGYGMDDRNSARRLTYAIIRQVRTWAKNA